MTCLYGTREMNKSPLFQTCLCRYPRECVSMGGGVCVYGGWGDTSLSFMWHEQLTRVAALLVRVPMVCACERGVGDVTLSYM